jgi:hypothetical protein
MSIPLDVRELAVATDRARDDYHAGRISLTDWTHVSDEFNDALEAWKDDVCPVEDLEPHSPQPGDIGENADGLSIITPHGPWNVTDDQALRLIHGLSAMLHARLTRPWSNDDQSTILTRGTRTVQEA